MMDKTVICALCILFHFLLFHLITVIMVSFALHENSDGHVTSAAAENIIT